MYQCNIKIKGSKVQTSGGMHSMVYHPMQGRFYLPLVGPRMARATTGRSLSRYPIPSWVQKLKTGSVSDVTSCSNGWTLPIVSLIKWHTELQTEKIFGVTDAKK